MSFYPSSTCATAGSSKGSEAQHTEHATTSSNFDTNKPHSGLKVSQGSKQPSFFSAHPKPMSEATSSYDNPGGPIGSQAQRLNQTSATLADAQHQHHGLASYDALPVEDGYSITLFVSQDVFLPCLSVNAEPDTSAEDIIQSHTTYIEHYLNNFDTVFDQK